MIPASTAHQPETPDLPVLNGDGDDPAVRPARLLEEVFTVIAETAMAGIPILNPVLSVRVVGMRPWGNDWLCVLITPWFMNLVALPIQQPVEGGQRRAGEKDMIILPAGRFEFIQAHHDVLGPYRMCSLFSPVLEFGDQDTAVMTAEQVLVNLFPPDDSGAVDEDDGDDDDGMALIWAGRIDDANERALVEAAAEAEAEAEEREKAARMARLQASPLADLAKPDARPDRRALFGLVRQPESRDEP